MFKTAAGSRNPTAAETLQLAASLIKADGCTSAPDLWFTACCNEHDVYYRTQRDPVNGRYISRREADKRLRLCMRATAKTFIGKWFVSSIYWGAVRVFGGAYWSKQEKKGKQNGTAKQ